MNPVPDRRRLRREYLRKKAIGYLMLRLSVVLPGIGVVAIVTANVCDEQHAIGGTVVVSSAACLLLVSLFALKMSGQAEIVSDVPYVPPVKPDTLPAEEILVRGATQPSIPSETLLRATMKGEETKADELLRVASGSTGAQDR
jgi:hypothetical protein